MASCEGESESESESGREGRKEGRTTERYVQTREFYTRRTRIMPGRRPYFACIQDSLARLAVLAVNPRIVRRKILDAGEAGGVAFTIV